jgi:hypothetical protein
MLSNWAVGVSKGWVLDNAYNAAYAWKHKKGCQDSYLAKEERLLVVHSNLQPNHSFDNMVAIVALEVWPLSIGGSHREYVRRYYEKNKDRVLRRRKAYYKKNRERIMAQDKKRRWRNREQFLATLRNDYWWKKQGWFPASRNPSQSKQ